MMLDYRQDQLGNFNQRWKMSEFAFSGLAGRSKRYWKTYRSTESISIRLAQRFDNWEVQVAANPRGWLP
jgi:hypothetical protein